MSAVTVAFFTLASIWEVATAKNVCFDEIGCFSMTFPWISQFRQLPEPLSPGKLPLKLDFYSRENPEGLYNVDLTQAPMNRSRPTVVIAHDYEDDGNALWLRSMKDGYLEEVDANVVIMDWGSGTIGFRYEQASANIRVFGRVMAKILRKSAEEHGLNPRDFHFIGEGLGAHLMGYVGKDFPGTGRITGLNPTRELFEFQDCRVRLDKDDADFVDVIHTSTRLLLSESGLGLGQPIGDVDFYVNVGEHQPGCEPVKPNPTKTPDQKFRIDWSDNTKSEVCDHRRARNYLLQALWRINNCTFWGHKRSIDRIFQRVLSNMTGENIQLFKTTLCTPLTCTPMGLKTAERPARGMFFIRTRGTSPYCIPEHALTLSEVKTLFHGMINSIASTISNRRAQAKEAFFPY